MINSEKREFGGWWLWILLLIIITSFSFFGLRYFGVVGERIIFENSYQKDAAENAKRNMLEAELAGINSRLSSSSSLTEIELDDLKSQKRAVQYQLNSME